MASHASPVDGSMGSPSFAGTTLRMFAPLIIWAVHFLVVYAFTAIACERNFAGTEWLGLGIVTWTVGGATLIAAAAALAMIWFALRSRPGVALRTEIGSFVPWMTAASGALTLLAILWEALPVLFVPVCS